LSICILTLFDTLWFLHTGYSWTNIPFAFLILLTTAYLLHDHLYLRENPLFQTNWMW
jgi:hypothetical protein